MTRNGFVDIQTNGWMGTDFADADLTVDRVKQITRELVAKGTIAFCPTIITSPLDRYERNLAVMAEAMGDSDVGGHILGIHVEGPFLSPEPGAVGAHPKECIRDPDPKLFDQFMKWADGKIAILTVAPERPNCAELVKHATKSGVAVAMGHHLASDEDMQRAVDAGASMCVHLGNGIPNEINRHDNPFWWLLANDSVRTMVITDGHHVPADMIKVVVRAKGADGMVVTSDASPLAGMPPGKYKVFGELPVVIDDTGLIYSEQSKSLAGSHSTVLECMNHLASLELLTEDQLWQVGFDNPLAAIGKSGNDLESLDGPTVAFRGGQFVAE